MSSERQGKRRASIELQRTTLAKCENCGNLKVPHEVCKNCGTYKGMVIVAPKIKTKVTRVADQGEVK